MKKSNLLRALVIAATCQFGLTACCHLMQSDEPVKYSKQNKELNAIYHFAFDDATLSDQDKPTLDEFAAFLAENRSLKAHVDGFTDYQGPHEYNMALGLRRAEAVAQYLQEKGVDITRIDIQSYGPENALDATKTLSANAKNRRAVIYVEEGNALA